MGLRPPAICILQFTSASRDRPTICIGVIDGKRSQELGDRHWALGIGNRRTLGRRRLTPQFAFCTSHFAFFPPALCPHPPSVKQGKATSAASAASARPIHHAQSPAIEGLASGEAPDGNLLSQRRQRQHGGWQRQQSRGRGICPGNVAGTRGLQPQFRSLIQPRCL